MIRAITAQDLDPIATIEAGAFARPLLRDDLVALSARSAFQGYVVMTEDDKLASYALFLAAAGAADLVSTGTATPSRRQGFASRLLAGSVHRLAEDGVTEVTLEVAVDNLAALALYTGLGFCEVGRRDGYYQRPDGRVDALVMRCRPVPQGTA